MKKVKVDTNLLKIIFIILFLFVLNVDVFSNETDDIENKFYTWLIEFKKDANKKYGIDEELLNESFIDTVYQPRIIEKDKNQPENKKTFNQYYNNLVDKNKIKNGKLILMKYSNILQNIEKEYGIPKEIIVAFWGLETNYGKNKGNTIIIDSLATLAFDNRRKKFFTNELISALKILQRNGIKKRDFRGSWAGAFGNFQFMPSTYLQYAIDGDQDGKIDIVNNIYDSLHSAGNFLSKLGWDKKYIWGREIKFDKNNKEILKYSNGEWRKMSFFTQLGIKDINGKNIKNFDIDAKIIAPTGNNDQFFLVYKNFKCIMSWNNSINYALTIGLLANELKK